MKKTLLIVGRSFPSLNEYFESHGYDFVILLDQRLVDQVAPTNHDVVIDFKKRSELMEAVKKIAASQKIDGVMAIYESYVLIGAEIADMLGLPGLPIETAKASTDKFLMRLMFARAPFKISPDFAPVKSEKDVVKFAKNHDFPIIIKPTNLSKSLLVSKSNSMVELLANYRRTVENIEAIYSKYAPRAERNILIEEYLEGSVHSVDAFVDSSGKPYVLDAVVDYQTGYDVGYDDNFHYSRRMPSRLSGSQIAKLREAAALGCQTLGIKNSPAHIEIIWTKDGPRIVEIGARNGGYRDRMHRLANGLDIRGNAIRIILGKQPDIKNFKSEPIAVFELFPKQPGIFDKIENENRLKSLPSFHYFSIKVDPGTEVKKSSDGHKAVAVVFLHNPNLDQLEADIKFVNNNVRVVTR